MDKTRGVISFVTGAGARFSYFNGKGHIFPMRSNMVINFHNPKTLSLEWFVPAKFLELAKGNLFKKTKNETYFVQCYEDLEDDWKICGNQTIYENSTIHMEQLQPYTKYKVR